MNGHQKRPVAPAMITGLTALLLGLILYLYRPEWAIAPLAVFVVLCLIAPFLPTKGFFLPVISRGRTGRAFVAVTFDDGPDPVTTGPLLELLDRHEIKAAFFVTGENAERHSDLIAAILEKGHDIGNHSYCHDPLLMLRSCRRIRCEIASTQILLRRFGIAPIAFRPPVGITNPKLAAILPEEGLYALNFSCRGNDFGNRRLRGLSRRILKKVKQDDIIMLHDIRPRRQTAVNVWLRQVDSILSGLRDKGLQIIPPAELIGRPIMSKSDGIGS
ncbi:MAG: polysaccharide deacetylase family protein [Syntrophales bacterium]|nr:polysaccharide deacetylase family protein [Syntrophales bacterium]